MTIAAAEERRRPDHPLRFARPGWNCWRTAEAERFAMLVDGAEYFRALKHALLGARRSILMLGWEFDSRTRLVRAPDDRVGPTTEPNEIGDLLDHLVRTRPGLRADVLIWDSAMIYAFSREFAGLIKMDWLTHRRLCFRLDDCHPIGASHHQKIVVVDEALAFVGGLDVTSQRWDSRAHARGDPGRSDPAFPVYPPFHDIMAMVTGPVAGALADIFRDRWRAAHGEILRPVPPGDAGPLWPPWVRPLLKGIEVAVARTCPSWDGEAAVREVEQLYLDLIASARRHIYIENQYFASRRIADALAARLAADDCPEMVVVNPGEPVSLVERSSMGVARARLVARLRAADRGNRLRLYFPTADGQDVKVHSKLMVIDDCVLRVGSANLNNRSMRLDSECDVMVEAAGDPAAECAIRALRHDLMAEHLGVGAGAVAAAEAASGSLHRAIEALRGGARTLVPLDCAEPSAIVRLIAESELPDPEEPVETLVLVGQSLPHPSRPLLQFRLSAMMLILVALTVAAALWRWAPFNWLAAARPWLDGITALRADPVMALLVAAGFLAGALARLPVPLLVLATAVALGPWLGALHALVGAVVSAALLFGLGRVLGKARLRKLAGWKINRVRRALSRHGVLAMVLLRLVPVAAFQSVNLVAGASGVRLRDFVFGTVLGMAPGILAMSVLGDRLLAVLRTPSVANIAVLALATTLVIAAQLGLVARLGRAGAPGPGRRQT